MLDYNRPYKLKDWIKCLKDITKEFPGNSVSINTAIRSFKPQIKELQKH